MPHSSTIIKILPLLDRFEKDFGKQAWDISDFANWLNAVATEKQPVSSAPTDVSWHGKNKGGKAHATASNLITAVNRYKMNYVKAALEGSIFETYDEFAFVLSLVFVGPYAQSALIERHVQLKPTGMEVIKRLLKKEIIVQANDEKDKRSKILSVTPAGKDAFYAALSKINIITEVVMSPLDETEKMTLLHLLQKMDASHRHFFNNHKKVNMDTIANYFVENIN